MSAIEWIVLAHIVGECLAQQAGYQVGSWPWCTYEVHLDRLATTVEVPA